MAVRSGRRRSLPRHRGGIGLGTRIRDAIHADAGEWGVSRRTADILLLLPFAGALLVVAAFAYRPAFRFLTAEDSLLEWLQVTCYVGTAIFALLCARELAGRRMPTWGLAYLALAAGCVFVVGEELAWGQRILGFGTPESLREINHQGETTVHNVGWLQDAFNVFLLVAALYGFAVSWLARAGRLPRWREFRMLAVPPLFLSSAFLVLFGYKAVRFTLLQEPRYAVVKAGELAELCMPAALLVMMLLVRRRLRDAPAPVDLALAGDARTQQPDALRRGETVAVARLGGVRTRAARRGRS
jgi:hypothetical protein